MRIRWEKNIKYLFNVCLQDDQSLDTRERRNTETSQWRNLYKHSYHTLLPYFGDCFGRKWGAAIGFLANMKTRSPQISVMPWRKGSDFSIFGHLGGINKGIDSVCDLQA